MENKNELILQINTNIPHTRLDPASAAEQEFRLMATSSELMLELVLAKFEHDVSFLTADYTNLSITYDALLPL